MINDIEHDRINMVVTKDLSRLGRDYLGTGEYIEKWFPEKNIRYISVNDGIDTFSNNNANNDIAPFKSILNDMYSKDLSKKIRTALHTMQKQGKWVGGKVALGYMKDPEDKNHLVICEEEAKIVRKIFDMAYAGITAGDIKHYLNENKMPTANGLRYNRPCFWENKTVKQILRNEVYIGKTIQHKRSTISYKNKKERLNPKDQWCVVENTHEPIIDKKIFDAIQKMVIIQRYERNEKKYEFLLDGLLFCYECKHRIGVKAKKPKHLYTVCNYYRRNSRIGLCTSHGFSYYALEERILQYIKNLFLEIDSHKIEINVKKNLTKYDYGKMLEKIEASINQLNDNLDKMYLEKINNQISQDMYNRLFNKLTQEIKEKEEQYQELQDKQKENANDNEKEIEKVVHEFLKLEKPSPELMRVIINRIELHQDKQVDIIFNFKRLNEISSQTSAKENLALIKK